MVADASDSFAIVVSCCDRIERRLTTPGTSEPIRVALLARARGRRIGQLGPIGECGVKVESVLSSCG